MSGVDDRDLEALLAELAPGEAERAALREEHRQLEKDLARLADPLPPADFVTQVMARVAAAPARAITRGEAWRAAGVVTACLLLALVLFLGSGGAVGAVGLAVASAVLRLREGLVAVGSGLLAVWTTAALPLVAALSLMLVATLAALRRLAGAPTKVVT